MNMKYKNSFSIRYEKGFEKDLKKLDKSQGRLILAWIKKNLVNIEDPRSKGKALQGNFKGIWRYRIGDYRLLAEIKDNELVIICLAVSHRKNIYIEPL